MEWGRHPMRLCFGIDDLKYFSITDFGLPRATVRRMKRALALANDQPLDRNLLQMPDSLPLAPHQTQANPSRSESAPAPAQYSLRGFWSLFVTQFQGAFSDNVLKNLVIFMMIGMNLPLSEKHKIGESVGALFALPFIQIGRASCR